MQKEFASKTAPQLPLAKSLKPHANAGPTPFANWVQTCLPPGHFFIYSIKAGAGVHTPDGGGDSVFFFSIFSD